MALSTNRTNVRNRLKIDPNGKVWGDSLLNRFINEGQRELLNDTDVEWSFQQTMGYVVPVDDNLSEIIRSSNDNPENYYSKNIKQFKNFWASTGGDMNRILTTPPIDNAQGQAPSKYDDYAGDIFYDAGYQTAATYTDLHNMDTYDGDGTWTAGDAETTTVATDAATYKEGAGCVSFNIDVSGGTNNYAEIYNADMTSVDISSVNLNQSAIVLWVYLPDATYFDEVSVYFGSSSANYYKVRNYKKAAQGNNYADGWNRIVIPCIKKSTTGTPDMSAVDYLKVRLGYTSDQTDQTACRVDSIQIVDKYIRYMYTINATDMSADTSESVIPNQYEYVYELYAEWQAWSMLSGREDKANQAYQMYERAKNKMKKELLWSDQSFFTMRTLNKY